MKTYKSGTVLNLSLKVCDYPVRYRVVVKRTDSSGIWAKKYKVIRHSDGKPGPKGPGSVHKGGVFDKPFNIRRVKKF